MLGFTKLGLLQPFRGRSVFTDPPRSFRANYVSDGDTNDALYYTGTGFGVSAWANPNPTYVAGLFSSTNAGSPLNLSDRSTTGDPGTTNVANSWLALDWGSGRSMQVVKYSLKNRTSDGTRAVRNFRLQGVNAIATWDIAGVVAAAWTNIDIRTSDTTMSTSAASWGTYNVATAPLAYRYLRILQNGTNALGDNYLLLNEWQFYGSFFF